MKKLKYTMLFIIFSLLLFASCAKEESHEFGGVVNFKLNLHSTDSDLNGLTNSKTFESRRLSTDRIGISGLLVFYADYDANRNLPVLLAYDMCCRNENRPDIKVTPNSDLQAVCKTCGSTYDLINGGRVISGPAKEKLYNYRVTPQTPYQGIFYVTNY